MSKVKIYFKSIILPLIVGGIIGILISNFMDYDMVQKPLLSPPAIVFPIVWTILYILMGVSYGILKNNNLLDSDIKFIYYLQLFLNALWPILFFIFKWRLFSFIWIIFLIVAVIVMIMKFYSKNKISGFLQIPYLLWLFFAGYLNLMVYILNNN